MLHRNRQATHHPSFFPSNTSSPSQMSHPQQLHISQGTRSLVSTGFATGSFRARNCWSLSPAIKARRGRGWQAGGIPTGPAAYPGNAAHANCKCHDTAHSGGESQTHSPSAECPTSGLCADVLQAQLRTRKMRSDVSTCAVFK